jgi:hypothetical protein
MARTNINVTDASKSGTVLSYVAADAANGMEFSNSGEEVLHVKNSDTAGKTVTLKSVPCSHGRYGDLSITVAAGEERVIGPFDTHLFNQQNGKVNVDFSAATSVTVCVVKR